MEEVKDWYDPIKKECPYKDRCKSYPHKCNGCKNNPANEDHYIHKPYPRPWHPWNPDPWEPYPNPYPQPQC